MNASAQSATRASRMPGWQAGLRRVLLFAVLWWVLSGGGGWIVGAPFILLAAWLSLNLWTEYRLSFRGIARFLPWFAVQSLAGASDVARRALLPRMPLQPGLVRHRLRLPAGVCRVSLANVVTMLPGTLSADLIEDELVVHTLDTGRDMHAMVLDLEPRIAALFGITLDKPATTGGGS
jgi:multicomponent Na+:H+ antiporter subunit E